MRTLFALSFLIVLNFDSKLVAETVEGNSSVLTSSILVLSQDDLFKKSDPGQALLKVFENRQSRLVAEAEKIELEFIAEEKKLTEQRSSLNSTDFQILAEEFDSKVKKMRVSRANKDKKLQKDFSRWRKKFVQIVLPIVREQMSRFGALVVLDTTNRGLIYDKSINVTSVIIQRLNEEYLNNPRILDQVFQED